MRPVLGCLFLLDCILLILQQQVPPNFERVLFLFSGANEVQEFVANCEKNGKSKVPEEPRKKVLKDHQYY